MKVSRRAVSSPSITAPRSLEKKTQPAPRTLDTFTPAKKDTRGYTLTNRGGKVLTAPEFQPIYLGSYWKTPVGAEDRKYNDAFAHEVVTGNHQAILAQYGVGKGSAADSVVVKAATPKRFTHDDVVALVKQQIATGAVKDGPQTVHMVVLPPGTVLVDGNATSLQGLGGFHGSYLDAAGKSVYFGVVCYSDQKNGIEFDSNPRDNLSIIESHEFDEVATDPDVETGRLGWYNNKYGEIGDLAVNSRLVPLDQAYGRDSGGFAVQVEWSNKDGKFLVGK
jgi:hypothetical protein